MRKTRIQKQHALLTPQNEQHNIHCASDTYRINLDDRVKMSAKGESALLKSEGEMGSAQKSKLNMNSQTSMRTEKIKSSTTRKIEIQNEPKS